MSWTVWVSPRVRAWRGRAAAFVELPVQRELPRPWCGVCQRPVDRVTDARSGRVVRLIAYCHGRMELVDVPLEQIQRADTLEMGVAFGQAPPPGPRRQPIPEEALHALRNFGERMNAAWREDINRRRRGMGLEPIDFEEGRRR